MTGSGRAVTTPTVYPFVVRDGYNWRLIGSYLSMADAQKVAARFTVETGRAHIVRHEP